MGTSPAIATGSLIFCVVQPLDLLAQPLCAHSPDGKLQGFGSFLLGVPWC